MTPRARRDRCSHAACRGGRRPGSGSRSRSTVESRWSRSASAVSSRARRYGSSCDGVRATPVSTGFARYIAWSAIATSAPLVRPSSGKQATPTLIVTRGRLDRAGHVGDACDGSGPRPRGRPSGRCSAGSPRTRRRRSDRACRRPGPRSSSPARSPVSRASPAGWPRASLNGLNASRSIIRTANGRPPPPLSTASLKLALERAVVAQPGQGVLLGPDADLAVRLRVLEGDRGLPGEQLGQLELVGREVRLRVRPSARCSACRSSRRGPCSGTTIIASGSTGVPGHLDGARVEVRLVRQDGLGVVDHPAGDADAERDSRRRGSGPRTGRAR